jgi:DNA repair photolyase
MAIVRVHEGLRARLGELLAPIVDGTGLPAGWRLETWEAEQGITLSLRCGPRALEVELEAADETRPRFATTRLFNVYFSLLDRGGRRDLDADERAALEAVVRVLREREGGLVVPPRAPAGARIEVREVEVDRALQPDGPGAWYLNPYVGCMLACPFCYAQHRADFSRGLEGLAPAPWGRWVDVKVNAPEVLARELETLAPGLVRMSPIITDPYQPVERRYRVTRGCLERMAGTAFTPVVLTRASAVLEDVPLLRRCRDATVGMSVPTDDDAMRAAFEPHTEGVDARLGTLRALREAGLRTFAVVQPMLPMDPERLAERLAPVVSAVRIGPLFEKPRLLPVFQRLGRAEALEERWELETFGRLSAALAARGVPVNPDGPEWSFLR